MLSRTGLSTARLYSSMAFRSIRCSPSASHQPVIFARLLSTKDVFGGSSPLSEEGSASAAFIPEAPTPPPYKKSIEEMYQDGESVIGELELFQWWKPSGYLRYATEYLHLNLGLEWWAAITCTTIALRMITVWVPIMSHKTQALISNYQPEIKKFQEKANDARRENNKMLIYQTMMEQRDFMRSKGIRQGRQLISLGLNASIFMTQFFAIKKMVKANFPGFSEGGALWFKDLTASDPFYALPLISAATMFIVMKVGIETGRRSDQMSPYMTIAFQYAIPLVVLIASSQFASALCVYWTTSNLISLLYSFLLQTKFVRGLFNITAMAPQSPSEQKANAFTAAWTNYRADKKAPPSLKSLKEKDALKFKEAGKGKPYKKVSSEEQ